MKDNFNLQKYLLENTMFKKEETQTSGEQDKFVVYIETKDGSEIKRIKVFTTTSEDSAKSVANNFNVNQYNEKFPNANVVGINYMPQSEWDKIPH